MKQDNIIRLRPTGFTLNEIRSKLAGFHFSKEALTQGEREILFLAESLLDLVDNHIEFSVAKKQESDTIDA